jgi:hypothetical protein
MEAQQYPRRGPSFLKSHPALIDTSPDHYPMAGEQQARTRPDVSINSNWDVPE